LNAPVVCGGVSVRAGDIVVADDEGVVVIPADRRDEVLREASAAIAAEAAISLDEWEHAHRARIDSLLAERGFAG